jgi:hypothetical protein
MRRSIVDKVAQLSKLSNPITIYSHQHAQGTLCDHHKMCRRIRHGLAKHPNSVHSFRWNSLYQSTHSVVDLIHYADKHNSRLIIDVNPNDVYARFLWKGIRHLYPDTYLFYTYRRDDVSTVVDSNETMNIKLPMTNSDDLTILNHIPAPDNLIVASSSDCSVRPYRARWITRDFNKIDLLYFPLLM